MPKTSVLAGVLLSCLVVGCSEEEDNTSNIVSALTDSKFEIDSNANLIVDDVPAGNLDWATVADTKKSDLASGQMDNSYGGGSKEDDPCPGVGTGSIPNNKSDLKTFGVYQEPGGSPGDPGFLHLFWTRVQDPTGTTLMDFEFNQAKTTCGNGVNPVRTAGDILLEYRIEQGGAQATIKAREWSGSAWGTAQDLTAVNAATGTINSSAIAAGNSDGLGALSARTFGEASIDLSWIFDEGKCTSFGSAMVKSRSSDAFTSQLKDFIAPVPINLTNCGKVIIRKETDPDGSPDSFVFTHNLATDPAQEGNTFNLSDGGAQQFSNVLFGNGYTVTENPGSFTLTNINCDASSGVTPTIDLAAAKITFDIDDDSDTVDCTYTNQAKGTLIIKKVSEVPESFDFTSADLSGFTLATANTGTEYSASKTFPDIAPGAYAVAESAKDGWHQVSATCDDGSSVNAIDVDAGETVTCTFVNARDRGALKIKKTRLHAASGPGWHAHEGVKFLVGGAGLGLTTLELTTDSNGEACVDGLLLGTYSATEVVPAGYVPAGDLTKSATIVEAGSCPNGVEIPFGNIPLTNITVSVDSQIPGGTKSTITCTGEPAKETDADGDGSLTLSDLQPGTYTCTVVIE